MSKLGVVELGVCDVKIQISSMDSPVGRLAIAATDGRVCLLHFGGDGPGVRRVLQRWYPSGTVCPHADPGGVVGVLRHYFAGKLDAFDAVEVEMNGTPFQRSVWAALRAVPAGSTVSYADIARAVGAPSSVRAVGAANGANPVALIVPCHRVVGSNGSLTGYGGGLDRKRWLLEHERARLF
jgi:methylated-DNA-[protein]-cysteine S-methyltransferase